MRENGFGAYNWATTIGQAGSDRDKLVPRNCARKRKRRSE